jgi:hypothetical protein
MPFQPGNKLGTGRPRGSRNKPVRDLDPRSPKARRFRDLLNGIISDLGGESEMSTAQMQLARRCAWVSVQCEALECSEPFDVTGYTTMMGHLSRTLKVLGLRREPRDVTPSLASYLETLRQPAAPEDEDEPLETSITTDPSMGER